VIDERLVQALQQAGANTTRSRPSPSGADPWSVSELDDLAMETVRRVRPDKFVLAANNGTGEAEFRSWLLAAVRTTLDLQARDTPAGWVLRHVEEALDSAEGFRCEAGLWRLASDERDEPWDGDFIGLYRAAWGVPTDTIRQSPAAEKIQIAWRRDMRSVCEAVLDVTGPLPKAVLGQVVAQRFNVLFASRLGYLDLDAEADDGEHLAVGDSDPEFETLDDEAAAQWMLTQLTDDERTVIRQVLEDGGVRELARSLGCGKDKASQIQARVIAKMKHLVRLTADDGQRATERLLDLIRHHQDLRHSDENDGRLDDL
jgi:hypothetical protein